MLNFEILYLPWTQFWDTLLFTSGILLVIYKYQEDTQRRANIIIPILAYRTGFLTHAILQERTIDLSNIYIYFF